MLYNYKFILKERKTATYMLIKSKRMVLFYFNVFVLFNMYEKYFYKKESTKRELISVITFLLAENQQIWSKIN